MNTRRLLPTLKAAAALLLALLISGCAGGAIAGRVQYYPNEKNARYFLVAMHGPDGRLRPGETLASGRVWILLRSMPDGKKIVEGSFKTSSAGFIDFESTMNERGDIIIHLDDRDSPRTWIAELRKTERRPGKIHYELIPPAPEKPQR